MKETICTAFGLVGSFIAALFGGLDSTLATLLIFYGRGLCHRFDGSGCHKWRQIRHVYSNRNETDGGKDLEDIPVTITPDGNHPIDTDTDTDEAEEIMI